jgi:hypothetical protein
VPLLGSLAVDIAGRNVTGSTQLELTAAQEVTMFSDIAAGTLSSVSLLHGTTAGGKVLVYAPNGQRLAPKRVEFNGRAHLGMDLRFIPSAGNDEVRIVAL